MNIVYQLLLFFLTPVFFWLTIKHYIHHKDSRYLWQRFFALKLPEAKQAIWFHCASVGEVMTVIPLIRLYQQQQPQQTLLISTATVTGANVCKKQLADITHCYLPLDYRHNIRRFIQKLNPEKLIIMETEIWPNLYSISKKQQLPIIIINGRLSSRTLESGSWFRKIFFNAVKNVSKIYCRTPEDAKSFELLGASKDQVETVGNLKFSASFNHLKSSEKLVNRSYVIVASTREHEEKKILELWKKSEHNHLLLIIAPRHPERRNEILKELSPLCTELKIRSLNQTVTDNTDVYLADTFGELPALFQHAEFVIMGGSFVNKGGHNILEPANFGKAIIFGPSMHNFLAESRLFIEKEAALQANDDESAINYINKLTDDKNYREKLGSKAKQLIVDNSNIASLYLQKLNQ